MVFVVECSFVLNLTFVFFPIWQCLQIEFEGLITFGRSITAFFSLDLIKLSQFKCPNLLWHSHISSTWLKHHFSSSSILMMYTMLYVLGATATSFPMSFSFISHFRESKVCDPDHKYDLHLEDLVWNFIPKVHLLLWFYYFLN